MDNDSRIKGLIRFIFSYFMETGGEIREGDKIIDNLIREGYSQEEVEYAILWVSMVLEKSIYMERDELLSDLESINSTFTRPLHPEERERLTPKAQSLIYWLTSTGQLSPREREDVLDLASYLDEDITDEMLFAILDTLYMSEEGGEEDPLYKYYYN